MPLLAALYDDPADAHRAVDALQAAGLPRERIGLIERTTPRRPGRDDTGVGPLAAEGTIASMANEAPEHGLVGSMVEYGIRRQDAETMAEGLRRGGAVVTTETSDGQSKAITTILSKAGAVDLREREDVYRGDGWTGFDEGDSSWSREQIQREREQRKPDEPTVITPVLPVR